jgi:diadenosine tetraphosphate (Ap4A) HIT family hydrolase
MERATLASSARMPETPEQLHARAAEALRMPPVEEWDTFPFDGEEPRHGEGGVDCRRCTASDDEYLWTNERWRLTSLQEPTGLPVIVLLEPREHYGEPGDLPDELAADLGVMVARVERAVRSVGEIGRVHVYRLGDGSEHLHWWFLGRPARFPQLTTNLVALWDDVLPPLPEDLWRENLAAVAAALRG